jgi:hypothetical protein
MTIFLSSKQKENNIILRKQNEDLRAKLDRTESILECVKEELAQYRASNGKNPYFDIEEEEQLRQNLKVTINNTKIHHFSVTFSIVVWQNILIYCWPLL